MTDIKAIVGFGIVLGLVFYIGGERVNRAEKQRHEMLMRDIAAACRAAKETP